MDKIGWMLDATISAQGLARSFGVYLKKYNNLPDVCDASRGLRAWCKNERVELRHLLGSMEVNSKVEGLAALLRPRASPSVISLRARLRRVRAVVVDGKLPHAMADE